MNNQLNILQAIGMYIITLSRRNVMLLLSVSGAIMSMAWSLGGDFGSDMLRFILPSALFAFFLFSSWSIWQYSQLRIYSVIFSAIIGVFSAYSIIFSPGSYSGLLFFLGSPMLLFLAGGIQLCLYIGAAVFVLAAAAPFVLPAGYSLVPFWMSLIIYLFAYISILIFAAISGEYKQRMFQSRKELRTVMDEYRSKEGFVAGLSHHIRTSLNTILGVSEMMKSSELNDLQTEMIEAVVTGANNLLSLSDEMLQGANFTIETTNSSASEEFDIQQVLNAWVEETNQTRIEEVQFSVRTNYSQYLPKGLTGNGVMLTEVLHRILAAVGHKLSVTSAVTDIFIYDQKETASAVELLIEVHTPLVLAPSDERINLLGSEIDLQDDEMLKRLGLLEISEFVCSKGGKLMVRHTASNLTVITFTALFWKNHADRHIMERIHKAVKAAEKRSVGRLFQANILVVEDNLMNQKVVSMALKNRVGKVDIANNGKEAIQLFTSSKYDIVLMDLMMPIMDGHKAAVKIRELEAGTGMRIPIIALTANARSGIKELCIESGMDDFITKPFKIDALIAKIEEHLTTII